VTETQTVDLAAWLTGIWDEEERLAKKAGGDRWILDGGIHRESHPMDEVVDWVYDEADEHIAYHDPASVLARIAADRKILALHVYTVDGNGWVDCTNCGEVGHETEGITECLHRRLLASPYKGREGWQEEWADE
jgi:hypothetical protein